MGKKGINKTNSLFALENLKIRMGVNGEIITVSEFLKKATEEKECNTWWRFCVSDTEELVVMKKKDNKCSICILK